MTSSGQGTDTDANVDVAEVDSGEAVDMELEERAGTAEPPALVAEGMSEEIAEAEGRLSRRSRSEGRPRPRACGGGACRKARYPRRARTSPPGM